MTNTIEQLEEQLEEKMNKQFINKKVKAYEGMEGMTPKTLSQCTSKEIIKTIAETIVDGKFTTTIEQNLRCYIVSIFDQKERKVADVLYGVDQLKNDEYIIQSCLVNLYEEAILKNRNESLELKKQAGITLVYGCNEQRDAMKSEFFKNYSAGKSVVYDESTFIDIKSFRDDQRTWIVFLTTEPDERAVFTGNRKATQRIEDLLNESKGTEVFICGESELKSSCYPYATKVLCSPNTEIPTLLVESHWKKESEVDGWSIMRRTRSEFE